MAAHLEVNLYTHVYFVYFTLPLVSLHGLKIQNEHYLKSRVLRMHEWSPPDTCQPVAPCHARPGLSTLCCATCLSGMFGLFWVSATSAALWWPWFCLFWFPGPAEGSTGCALPERHPAFTSSVGWSSQNQEDPGHVFGNLCLQNSPV